MFADRLQRTLRHADLTFDDVEALLAKRFGDVEVGH